MTPEALLITALSSVTGALCWSVRILFLKADQCTADRADMQKNLDKLREDYGALREKFGELRGRLAKVDSCPIEDCPHALRTPALGSPIS